MRGDGCEWFKKGNIKMETHLDQMRSITEELVETYSSRIGVVTRLISETYEMMDQCKENREYLRQELRELLAKETTLRRKDFDALMAESLSSHSQREREVRKSLRSFLEGQQTIALELNKAIKLLDRDVVDQVKQKMERDIHRIRSLVLAFHQEQSKLIQQMKSLLKKGERLTVAEFKEVLAKIRKGFTMAKPVFGGNSLSLLKECMKAR